LSIQKQYEKGSLGSCILLSVCAMFCCSIGAWGQGTATAVNEGAPFSIRATHLLGFPDTKGDCNGVLTIQGNTLQFQRPDKPAAEVRIASIQGVFLGGESKQVGGVPVKVGKAAAPFGGGRVVSLFAHKKYDTLTLEYTDGDGGVHGAVFQMSKGQAERVRNELVARGVLADRAVDQAAEHSNAEASHANN